MKKEIIPPKIQIPPISVEDKIKMFKTALVSKSNTQDESSNTKRTRFVDPYASITTYDSSKMKDRSVNFGQTQESGYIPTTQRELRKKEMKQRKEEIAEVLEGEDFQRDQKELEQRIQSWKDIVKDRKKLFKQMLDKVAEDDDEPNHPLKNKQNQNTQFAESKRDTMASHNYVTQKMENPRKAGGRLEALRVVNEKVLGGRAGALKRNQEERNNGRIQVEFFRNPTSTKQRGQTLQEKMELDLIDILKMRSDLEDIGNNTRNPRLYLKEFKGIHSDEMVMAAYLSQLKNLVPRRGGPGGLPLGGGRRRRGNLI